MARRTNEYQTIRSEGGLLPTDLLRRVLDPKEKLPGTLSEDYGLPQGARINDVITQSWNRLRKHWAEFRASAEKLSESDPATGLTNDKWNLPLLRELDFGLLPTSAGPEVGGRTYAINRFFGPVPIHLIGCGLSLDRRAAGVRGAAALNPHGLVQEFLNRKPGHVWGIVSNGLRFRMLRDNQALSRQSFLEFDLEAIFAGEVYSDFVIFWLMAHATRLASREGECWLEEWTKLADEQGTRALGELRGGVERALQILGEGFVSHPKNAALRDVLRTGQIRLTDLHGQLLRVVYRLIFLFVAEDRTLDGEPLLHPRDDSEEAATARERYSAHYSTDRLRELASKIKGSRHGDLWRQFQVLVGALSGDVTFATVRNHLALPALGSFLWNPDTTSTLNNAELTNHDFLEALQNLAFTRQGKVLRPVDYKNLGAEELGGVYESLLSLTPQLSADGARFYFAEFAGNERKTSGSYYTPDSLVQCLLDSALDPVVEDALKGTSGVDAEKGILSLKVCDPAVGSGHFLVGAAHRLTRHLARARALTHGESEPSPLLYQHALRDVIGHCLYGVDMNPMAAELCRLSLWLEALEPGKPLSFLDHHIRVGNSLFGTTPELIAAGLPDDAFNPIEGDDKKVCSALKKRNKQERESGQQDMVHLMVAEREAEYSIEARRRSIDDTPDDTLDAVQQKADQFGRLIASPEYQHAQQVADAWCAALVWKRQTGAIVEPITTDSIRRLTSDSKALTQPQVTEIESLSREYQFFHWHLAFPEVFGEGGFDCVLGNPPWEVLKAEENASNEVTRPRRAIAQFTKASGRFPLGSHGKANTMPLFLELSSHVIKSRGLAGLIVKTVIATERDYRIQFTSLVESRRLVSLFDFENSLPFFEDVHRQERFCLMTIAGAPTHTDAVFGICLREINHLRDDGRIRPFSPDALRALGGGQCCLPSAEGNLDVAVLHAINRHSGRLFDDSWSGRFFKMLDTTQVSNDPDARTAYDLRAHGSDHPDAVPVYEGKFFEAFDHRAAGVDGNRIENYSDDLKISPMFRGWTRYYLPRKNVAKRLLKYGWTKNWVVIYGRKVNRNNVRTMSSAVIPIGGAVDTCPTILFKDDCIPLKASIAVALLNSFAFDYLIRSRLSGFTIGANHLASMAIPDYTSLVRNPLAEQICTGVLELSYTSWDLEPFAQDCGWSGPPFRWDEERRFLLRCELDAAFFHLYLPATPEGGWKPARSVEGAVHDETPEQLTELTKHFPMPRDAVDYIMETFPIVIRKDIEKYGDYRTKLVTLDIYDRMLQAIATGRTYQTLLDPPPADPRCCHPPRQER